MKQGDYHQLRVELIKHPMLAKERDSSNRTLLLRLTENANVYPNAAQTARVLLINGSEVHARVSANDETPLFQALKHKNPELARVLAEFGASFQSSVKANYSILEYAIALYRQQDQHCEFAIKLQKLILDYTGANIQQSEALKRT